MFSVVLYSLEFERILITDIDYELIIIVNLMNFRTNSIQNFSYILLFSFINPYLVIHSTDSNILY